MGTSDDPPGRDATEELPPQDSEGSVPSATPPPPATPEKDREASTQQMSGLSAEARRMAKRVDVIRATPSAGTPQSSEPTEVIAASQMPRDFEGLLRPLVARMWVDVDLPVVDAANYERLGEHARGGLGRIVKARDIRTGRIVALKEMIDANAAARQRFTREAVITANLQHPAIVPVYEMGRWKTGEPFIAMKLVEGRSLADVLKGASLDERLGRLPVILSVAEALAYAHERRIVHRDLKPANVLVGDYGETVVIDWGLAKSVDEIDASAELARAGRSTDTGIDKMLRPRGLDPTVAGAVLGTPAYMSPEQARGEAIDERSDVYSIGALLYHLISGHRPYLETGAKTAKEIVEHVGKGPPAALGVRESGAPPDLITIVNKAMARERDARYAHGGELADDLRRFLTGQLVAAHHYDRTTLFLRWLNRNRAPVIVGLVLAVLLAVVGAIGLRGVLVERDRVRAQRDIAVQETARAERQLAAALYEKGRVAEVAQEWPKAAMYYAASRKHHDTPAAAWAAGLADARAVIPSARYEGHAGVWVHAIAISPDGSKVASVDDGGNIRLWSPTDGATIAQGRVDKVPLYAVAFSPDGSELAVAGDDGVITRRSLDLVVRTELRGHTGRVWSLAYSPDGATLASSGEDSLVKLWNLTTGVARDLRGHVQRVYSVEFSADGTQLVSGSDDRHVWLWDVATGKGASRGNHTSGGIRVAMFAPEGLITTGWDHEVRLWPNDGGAPAVWTDTHIVHGAATDPRGEVVITAGESEMIRIWDISTHQLVTLLDAPGGHTSAVAFSKDGRWFVTGGKSAPVAWDARPLARLDGVGHRGDVVALEPNLAGSQFVSGSTDNTIRTWDLVSARELRRITTRAYCGDGLAVLPGDELVASCNDKVIHRWDRTGVERQTLTAPTWLRFLSLSPDHTLLAAGHVDGNVAVLDLATWTLGPVKKLHEHHIYDVTFAADGRLVTASLDDHVRTWTGRELAADLDIVAGSDDGVLAASLSPDGSQLAAGGQDGHLRVWDTKTKTFRVQRKDVAAGTIWMLRYTPDGTRAITANDDGGVRVWNTATWDEPVVLQAGEGTALSIAITPDSRTLLTGFKSGAIVIWDLATSQVRVRIGGRVRERGSCAEIAKQAWHDAEHAAVVTRACSSAPASFFDELLARSHQEIDEGVDVRWSWAPRSATPTAEPEPDKAKQ